MKRVRIVIVGAGGQAKIVADALAYSEFDEVLGFVDDHRAGEWFGYPVLGPVSALPDIGADGGIVSLGDNFARGRMVARIEAMVPDFHWVNAIHPSAWVAHRCDIGKGVLMMAGAVVNPDSVVGDHSSIDTRASLDHDSVLGSCSSLAPNVATGGGCVIGDFTAISIGTSVAHGRTVGNHSVVGAGSVVVRDIPDHVVAYGSPAVVVRQRQEGEKYL